MPEIEIALWQRYIQVAEARKESFHKHRRKEITDEEWLVLLETDTTTELQDLCAKSYADSLMQFPEEDRVSLYFADIKRATKIDDLHMLHILDFAPTQCPISVPVEIDEFLLRYYVDFFKRTTDTAGTTFEVQI